MLLFKQFSTIIGNKSYLDNGNFQWDMTVHENSVELVMSNVFNILCTPYGTQPLLRTFGLSSSWIDQPGSIGLMQAKIAALLSISLWEPRAIVRDLEFFLNPSDIMAGLYSVAIEIEVDRGRPCKRSCSHRQHRPPCGCLTRLSTQAIRHRNKRRSHCKHP